MTFSGSGSVSSDSLDDSAFMALSISMTMRIDSDTVDADLAMSSVNMWQPISGNCAEQRWKCAAGKRLSAGPPGCQHEPLRVAGDGPSPT